MQGVAALVLAQAVLVDYRIQAAEAGEVGAPRISFLKTFQIVQGLWHFLEAAADLMSPKQLRLVVRRTLRHTAQGAIPKRRHRACPGPCVNRSAVGPGCANTPAAPEQSNTPLAQSMPEFLNGIAPSRPNGGSRKLTPPRSSPLGCIRTPYLIKGARVDPSGGCVGLRPARPEGADRAAASLAAPLPGSSSARHARQQRAAPAPGFSPPSRAKVSKPVLGPVHLLRRRLDSALQRGEK